jgi:hypothetical protein
MCHLEITHPDGRKEELPLRYCGREICFLDKVRLTGLMFRKMRARSDARIVTRTPEKVCHLLHLPKDEPGIVKPKPRP